ncbi:hypothetical protein, partial [Actinoplanes philippinensis]|uniref:hypothetical protein n=1 Tax=Actinoplanes philippinensis TaxID=35752 RepID=UPI0033E270B1
MRGGIGTPRLRRTVAAAAMTCAALAGTVLVSASPAEDRDAVAHGEGLVLVVGDEDEGDADVALDLL